MLLNNRLIIGLFATIALGVVYINISLTYGRLSHDIMWDDIYYVLSGFKRIDTLMRSGLYGFLISWVNPIPHSIYSEALAVLSIFVFGMNDAGFYYTNILILILFYLFIYFSFNTSDRLTFALIFLFAMSSPLPYSLLENFRPDLTLGLATTGMAWWTLRGMILQRDRDFLWGGLSFAFALLIKPTFFAHTIAVGTGLAVLAVAIELGKGRIHRQLDLKPMPALTFLLMGLLIASPYYVVAGGEIWEYFWTNTRGSESYLWSFSEDMSPHRILVTYIASGYFKHGGMQVPAAAIVSLILSSTLYFYGKRGEATVAALLLVIAGCSLAVMVFGRHKNEFFFATFHMLIMLSALYAVSMTSAILTGAKKLLFLITFAGIIILTSAFNYKSLTTDTRQENLRSVSENKSIATQITQILAQEGRASDIFKEPATVYISFVGPVTGSTIEWEARKAGFLVSTKEDNHSGVLTEHLDMARSSDFVVLPYSMNAQYERSFPSASIQNELGLNLLNDPEFRVLPPRSASDHYIVLERRRADSERVFDIGAPGSRTGFGPEEGPYPQWDLPNIAWMSSPVGNVCLYEPGRYQVALEARSETDVSVEVLSLKGVPLAKDTFNANQFQSLSFIQTFTLNDPCISIKYGTPTQSPSDGNYLLFRKLKISKITAE